MTSAMPHDEAEPLAGPGPGAVERAHAWVLERWPRRTRSRIAIIAVLIAVAAVGISTAARLVGAAVDAGMLAYLGLMVVCWVGAGGALVPVPGVRPLSWVMIVHQSTVLAPPVVAVVAALAMALGQSSYFVATRIEARRHQRHHGHGTHGLHAGATAATQANEGVGGSRQPNKVVARSRAMLAGGQAAVERRMASHPKRILFLLCVVPNPLTTFATVTAASTSVPFASFFVASLAGFTVLTVALAVAGQAILGALGLL